MEKKILVVDDEHEIVNIVKKMLKSNYEVITAYSGEECIQIAIQEKPDLIFLDILMPKLDGWETLARLKEIDELKEVPVSMLTALPLTPEDTKDKPIDKIENYIVKPFSRDILLKKIEDIFEKESEAKRIYEKLNQKLGKELADNYLRMTKAVNRHKRLIGVLVECAAETMERSVKNLIISQKRLIETMKKRADEIEKLLDKKR